MKMEDGGRKERIRIVSFFLKESKDGIVYHGKLRITRSRSRIWLLCANVGRGKVRDDRCGRKIGRNKGKLIWERGQRLKTTILPSTFTLNRDTVELTSRKIP